MSIYLLHTHLQMCIHKRDTNIFVSEEKQELLLFFFFRVLNEKDK